MIILTNNSISKNRITNPNNSDQTENNSATTRTQKTDWSILILTETDQIEIQINIELLFNRISTLNFLDQFRNSNHKPATISKTHKNSTTTIIRTVLLKTISLEQIENLWTLIWENRNKKERLEYFLPEIALIPLNENLPRIDLWNWVNNPCSSKSETQDFQGRNIVFINIDIDPSETLKIAETYSTLWDEA